MVGPEEYVEQSNRPRPALISLFNKTNQKAKDELRGSTGLSKEAKNPANEVRGAFVWREVGHGRSVAGQPLLPLVKPVS